MTQKEVLVMKTGKMKSAFIVALLTLGIGLTCSVASFAQGYYGRGYGYGPGYGNGYYPQPYYAPPVVVAPPVPPVVVLRPQRYVRPMPYAWRGGYGNYGYRGYGRRRW